MPKKQTVAPQEQESKSIKKKFQKSEPKKMSASEIRHDRFIRVASKRGQRAMEDLRLVAACANRRVYSYSEEEVAKLLAALESQVNSIRKAFAPGRKREEIRFDLSE